MKENLRVQTVFPGALCLVVLCFFAACNSATETKPAPPWYVGQWEAVTANGQPLPYVYREVTGTNYEVQSLVVKVFDFTPTSGSYTETYRYLSAATQSWLSTSDAAFVDVVASNDSLNIRTTPTASGSRLYRTFFRSGVAGDTLVLPSYRNTSWRLVRRGD